MVFISKYIYIKVTSSGNKKHETNNEITPPTDVENQLFSLSHWFLKYSALKLPWKVQRSILIGQQFICLLTLAPPETDLKPNDV